MNRCSQCQARGATHTMTSGRLLCDRCFKVHAGLAGAGSSLVGGGDLPGAVGTGIATAGFSDSVSGEAEAMRKRRAKLDATTGFWRRLWVRVVG